MVGEGATFDRRIELGNPPIVIGRDPEAGIRLDSGAVSRAHAELYRDPFQRWWVRDLGSRNGVKINGTSVKEHAVLPTDTIGIGPFRLRLAPAVQPDDTAGTLIADDEIDETEDAEISTLPAHDRERLNTSHLATLGEFGARLAEIDDPAERRRKLCRLLVRHDFPMTSAMVLRVELDHRGNVTKIVRRVIEQERGTSETPYVSKTLLRSLVKNGTPMLAVQGDAALGGVQLSISPTRVAMCAMACPLDIDGDAVEMLYTTAPTEYGTPEWLAMMALVTQHFRQIETTLDAQAQAREHAMIERDLAQAEAMQARLVPVDPRFDRLRLSIGFEPCRWVGGDYVDAVRYEHDDRVFLFIADVCGKGLAAALVAAELHAMVHALVNLGTELSQIMNALNTHLIRFLEPGRFATAIGVCLDPATGHIETVNAGHPPIFVVSRDGGCVATDLPRNPPLGLVDGPLRAGEMTLDDGQTLVMITDGILEMRDDRGEMLGVAGTAEALTRISNGDVDAGVIAEGLQRMAASMDGHHAAADDRTFIVAQRAE